MKEGTINLSDSLKPSLSPTLFHSHTHTTQTLMFIWCMLWGLKLLTGILASFPTTLYFFLPRLMDFRTIFSVVSIFVVLEMRYTQK